MGQRVRRERDAEDIVTSLTSLGLRYGFVVVVVEVSNSNNVVLTWKKIKDNRR